MKFRYGQEPKVWEKMYLTISRLINYTRTESKHMPITRFFDVLDTIKEDSGKWGGMK